MRLSRIGIRQLGQVHNLTIDQVSPQLTVVFGPNEAGKSTVRDAVRYTLFGFPTARSSKDLTDVRHYLGLNREVSAGFTADGTEVIATRTADGRKATAGSLAVWPPSHEAMFDELLSGVDDRMYHTMWNVSLANLAGIDPSKDANKVLGELIAAEHGTAISPTSAASMLGSDLDRIFSPTGAKSGAPTLKSTIEEITRLKSELIAAQSEAESTASLRSELERTAGAIQETAASQRSLSDRAGAIARDVASIKEMSARIPELTARVAELEDQMREAADDVAAADGTTVKQLLSVAGEVRELELSRALIDDKRREIGRLSEAVVESQARLAQYANVPDVIDDADTSRLLQRLEQLDRDISKSRGELLASETEVKAEEGRLLAARAQLAEAEARAVSQGVAEGGSEGPLPTKAKGANLGFTLGVAALIIGVLGTAAVGMSNAGPVSTAVVGSIFFGFAAIAFFLRDKTTQAKSESSEPSAPRITLDDTRLTGALAAMDVRSQAATHAMSEWATFVASEPLLASLRDLEPDQLIATVNQSSKKAELNRQLASDSRTLARAVEAADEWDRRVRMVAELASGPEGSLAPTFERLIELVRAAEQTAVESARIADLLPGLERQLGRAKASLVMQQSALDERMVAAQQSNLDAQRFAAQSADAVTVELESSASLIAVELERLTAEVNELLGRQGELQQSIRHAESSHDVERISAQLEAADARLASLTRNYAVTLLAQTIIERGVEHFQGEERPGVIDRASEVLTLLTGGAYTHIDVPEGDSGDLGIVGADGQRKSVGQLSVGTVEQLYLAIRFGALLALPTRGCDLPILLDEVLANYDEDRSLFAYDAISALAEHRQVVYFTCREEIANGLKRSASSAGIDFVRVSIEAGRVIN